MTVCVHCGRAAGYHTLAHPTTREPEWMCKGCGHIYDRAERRDARAQMDERAAAQQREPH